MEMVGEKNGISTAKALAEFCSQILSDSEYIQRLKDHYAWVRRHSIIEQTQHRKASPGNNNIAAGRNQLCPCGSGKKYKKCCMTKG